MITKTAFSIFEEVIRTYHIIDSVDQPFENPYNSDDNLLAHLLLSLIHI